MQTKQGALNLTNVNSSSSNGSGLIAVTSQYFLIYWTDFFFLGEGELDTVLIGILAYCAKMIIYCLITWVKSDQDTTIKFLWLCNVC